MVEIPRGSRPGDLPVIEPISFEAVINLKTAKALALTLRPLLLQWAAGLIE